MELSYFILSTVNDEKKCRCRDETTRQHCDDTDTGNCKANYKHDLNALSRINFLRLKLWNVQ